MDNDWFEVNSYTNLYNNCCLNSNYSAYCGGLWLAALFAMTKIAKILQKNDDVEKFQKLLDKGKVAFEQKLWNGKYYNFDCSNSQCRSIMADQLCAQWYLKCSGFNYEV